MNQRLATSSFLLASVLWLGACGDSDEAVSTSATDIKLVPDKATTADIDFAKAVRTQAEGTIQVALLGKERASDQRVKDIAVVISDALANDIGIIDAWLTDWKVPAVSSTTRPTAQRTDALTRLGALASGAAFDRALIEALIIELQAFIPIAQKELESGSAVNAVNLASRITNEQPGEIEEMQGLLGELP